MKVVYLILLAASLVACNKKSKSALPYFNTPDFTPVWIDESNAPKVFHTIPAFSFIDQHGSIVTKKTIDHKIYIADFFFTRCAGICPKMTTNMQKVSTAFANDSNVMILSHSVTPVQDSVPVLKQYATAKNIANPNWHLLTGDKDRIYDIARNGYFVDKTAGYNKDTSEFLHTENFILVDRHQRIRGIYNGTVEVEIEQLIKHIHILEEEDKREL